MIKRAILPLSILIILLITNLLWFGKYIDSSLTIDSLGGKIFYKNNAISDLEALFLKVTSNTNKEELKEILRNTLESPEIFEMNGNVYYKNLGFIFKNKKLVQVTTEVPFNPDGKG